MIMVNNHRVGDDVLKSKPENKENSIIDAERKAYLFRLRKKSLQNLELSKCVTLEDVERVTNDIIQAKKQEQTSKNLTAFSEMHCIREYDEDIPIIQDNVGLVTTVDLKNAGHIDKKGNFSEILRRELETTRFYNEEGFQISQKSLENKLQEIIDESSFEDETRKFNHSSGFDAYREKIESGDWANIFIHEMQLPGNGMFYKSCGMFQVKGCLDSSHKELYQTDAHAVRRIFKRCNKLSCPKCWSFAINKQSLSAVDRLEATLSFKKNKLWRNNPKTRIYNHLVVSIPKSKHDTCKTHKGRLKIEQCISKKLQLIGIEGGTMIYHPFRFAKKLESVYYSPHVHVLGFGYTDKKDIMSLHDKTGYVVKSINTFRNSKTAYNTVRYLLSHTGLYGNKHRIKYFGDSANNKFSTKSILAKSISSVDDLSTHVTLWQMLRRTKNGNPDHIPLKKVSVSLMAYDDESDIKTLREIDSDSFDLSITNINNIQKRVQDMALHLDNPAKTKSMPGEHVPHQFLHVRLLYGIEKSKPLYRYKTIILDFDESKTCPICSRKLHPVKPNDHESLIVADLPLDETILVDGNLYEYVESFSDPRGMMYFDEDGRTLYDDGIHQQSQYFDVLPNIVRSLFKNMIHHSTIKASLRLTNGITPTNQEIDDVIQSERLIAESIAWHKTSISSDKITKWIE